jgi:uncharacterized membrane protein YphA (DoxX/SURF4 family)
VIATLVAVGRAVLAVTLLASGGAKLGDLASFADTVRGVGIPPRHARSTAGAVALLETMLGALALGGRWVTPVDAAILALLIAFVGISAYAVKTRPDLRCRCFGSLSDARFGRRTLLRTLGLAVLAALVVAGERVEAPGYGGASAATWVTLAAALALALVCAQAARTLDVVQRRAESS